MGGSDLSSSLAPRGLSRRSALAGGAAAASIAGLTGPGTAASATAGGLRAVIDLGGKAFDYDAGAGEDLGDFVSEIGGFTQSCTRVMRSDCPVVVFFRPDRGSDRIEVVFELGRLWKSEPAHLEAYSVKILHNGGELAKIDVPRHLWFSRWRWQSAPRPVVGNVADLMARNLLLRFKTAGEASAPAAAPNERAPARGLPGSGPALPTAGLTGKGQALGLGSAAAPRAGGGGGRSNQPEPYAIMGLAGITPAMGQTGERPDIGLVTGYQGNFITTGTASALTIVRDQAEGAGTVPWHLRDERTGAPIDLDAYPKASWYSRNDGADPHFKLLPSDITVDSAHQPALAYLPYLLTGDPYHLEDMQFAANWNRGTKPPRYRLSVSQARAFAWSMRTLGQCAKVTPAKTPRWLLPQAYWRADLDRMLAWFVDTFVNSRVATHTVFRCITDLDSRRDEGVKAPAASHVAPWEDEFVASVFGWLVLMGFEGWKKAFEWKIANTIARTNGRSGWVRAHCTPYRQLVRSGPNVPYLTSWGDSYALTARLWEWKAPDPDSYDDPDPTYLYYTRGALVIAAKLGIAEADECLRWAEGQISRRNLTIPPKWRLI